MAEEMKMSVSGMMKNKAGEKVVYVTFENASSFAEGELLSGKITQSRGLSKEEIDGLEKYLSSQKAAIMDMAKTVDPMKAFLADGKNAAKNGEK